jgi:hypothetical protein
MSTANTPSFPDFGKLVPGFDFLQNLTKQAGSATQAVPQLPKLGSWIAPTLNVEELDKRVQELKAVQFWLDQNAAALKATIQALELQKMTLATLKGMNFNMNEVANAFMLKGTDSAAGGMPKSADKAKTFAGLEIPPSAYQTHKAHADAEPAEKAPTSQAGPDAAPAAGPGVVDPMQWWGALTQQFQTIAAEAMKEVAKTTALDASKVTGIAKDAVKTATDMTAGLAKGMAETASKTMASGAAMKTALGSSWPKADAAKASRAGAKTAASKPAPKAAAKPKPKAPARKTAGTSARKTAR